MEVEGGVLQNTNDQKISLYLLFLVLLPGYLSTTFARDDGMQEKKTGRTIELFPHSTVYIRASEELNMKQY